MSARWSAAPFGPTHLVPCEGLQAWSEPDAGRPSIADLGGGLPVQVVEQRGQWSYVRCANGWMGWVDGARLTSAPAERAPLVDQLSLGGVGISALLGAVLVVVGSFLPWWTVNGASVTAWHIPVKFLLAGTSGSGEDAGPFLLVVVLVALPVITRRPLPFWAFALLALVPAVAGLGGLIRGLRATPSLHPGVGLILVLAGALLVALQTPGVASFRLRRGAT